MEGAVTHTTIVAGFGDGEETFASLEAFDAWLAEQGESFAPNDIVYKAPVGAAAHVYEELGGPGECTVRAQRGELMIITIGPNVRRLLGDALQLFQDKLMGTQITVTCGDLAATDKRFDSLYALDVWLAGEGATAVVQAISYERRSTYGGHVRHEFSPLGHASLYSYEHRLAVITSGPAARSALTAALEWYETVSKGGKE